MEAFEAVGQVAGTDVTNQQNLLAIRRSGAEVNRAVFDVPSGKKNRALALVMLPTKTVQ